jgi:formyltetrahydrofolate-dependent phosphoribosylglycinamide formyltransferase
VTEQVTGRKKKFACLISGRGSNMAALLKASKDQNFAAEPVLVISDNEDAAGLETAAKAGVTALAVQRKNFSGRSAFEQALTSALKSAKVDIICLAGFMRLLSSDFVSQWQGKLINIHPSLLPSFPGLGVQQQAIDAGVKISGCTVHFVDAGIDTGAIVGQTAVPVLPGDDAHSLAGRILSAEHQLYARCLNQLAQGEVFWSEGKARYATEFRNLKSDQILSLP